MVTVRPIGQAKQERVVAATAHYIHEAEAVFGRRFELIPVVFDLTGRAAGMYRVSTQRRVIRYNPYLFAKYFDDNLTVTVPHEVAHYITDQVYGLSNIRPHGAEWKRLMQAFGADASRTCAYDLSGVPIRTYKRHRYRCGCTTHHLTARRHNKVRRGTTRYYCRQCGEVLTASDGGENDARDGEPN